MAMVGLAVAANGCDRSSANKSKPERAAATLPSTLFLTASPAKPAEISAARSTAKPGEKVVLGGRVGGRKDPFVDGRAIFTIAETSLPTCDAKQDDGCTTPWDYCCETPEELRRAVATIQVVDAAGLPLKSDLKNVGNLKPMAEVVVEGRIAGGSTADSLVVDASGIFVKPK